MTRVLVTGGAGFISSNLCRHLLRATDHEVVIMDALTYAGNTANIADLLGHERLAFVEGDIRDAAHVEEIVAGVDVIVNAAAESHVEKSILDGASEFVTTNVEGTQVLLDACRRHPVERFVLVSSSEVYGTAERDPMDEEHPLNPRSPYAATKAGGDRLVYSYWCTYGTPAVVVRPFNNYGPYQHPEKVIPRFITAALQDRPLTVHGGGGASRDWLHVEDTSEAIAAIIAAPLRARRRAGAQRRHGRRRRRAGHRRAHLRQPRQAALADRARAGSTRPGRSPHRLDRRRRPSSSAGARASASTRASSARSAGTPTTRPGGPRTWPPSPSAGHSARTPRPSSCSAPGAGQLGALAAARRSGVDDGRRATATAGAFCLREGLVDRFEHVSAMDLGGLARRGSARARGRRHLTRHRWPGARRRGGACGARAAAPHRPGGCRARHRQARAASRVRSRGRAAAPVQRGRDGISARRRTRRRQARRGAGPARPDDRRAGRRRAGARGYGGAGLARRAGALRGVRRGPGAHGQRVHGRRALRPADGDRSRARAGVRRRHGAPLPLAAAGCSSRRGAQRPPAGRSA